MKKIPFIALNIFIFIFSAEGFVAAADVKKALPSVPPLPAAVQKQEATQPTPTVLPPESAYNYNPLGKPDPFRPIVEEQKVAAKKIEEKKDLSSIFPLQRMELEQFRIVGIAGNQLRRVAIVEDATKKFYPLFVGTHIGLRNGKVVEILADRVIVEEYAAKKAKRIILKLHKN